MEELQFNMMIAVGTRGLVK